MRVTTVQGDAGGIDDVVRLVKERVAEVIATHEGSRGVSAFVDRENGRVVATTAWISEQARAASNTALAPLRAEAERLMSGTMHVSEWEIVVNETAVPPTPGCWMRSTALQGDAAEIREGVHHFQATVIPGLRGVPGFCGAMLMVDRRSGRVLASTLWDGRATLDASRERAGGLRATAATATGARVTGVSEYEVVLTGLEVLGHEHLFRLAYETMSNGDLDDLDDILAEDLIEHAPLPPGIPAGRAGVKQLMAGYREAFPDLRMTIEKYIEQGDVGCAVLRVTGTHTGPLLGQPATGRTVDICMVDMVRVADGRAVEHWGASDDLGLFAQLGISPPLDATIPAQTARTIELGSKVDA